MLSWIGQADYTVKERTEWPKCPTPGGSAQSVATFFGLRSQAMFERVSGGAVQQEKREENLGIS